jgi:hypothetical protein
MFVYLLSGTGMAYSLHFCGEKLTSYTYQAAEKKPCSCKRSEATQSASASDNSCCSDQELQLSSENSKTSGFDFKLGAPAFHLLPAFFLQLLSVLLYSHGYAFSTDTSDAPYSKVPIYLLNRYFII